MSTLPKIDLPKYKHTLTGTGKEVTYRPFTVKEQKILLLAKQSQEPSSMIDAVKQIIELCTFSTLKADNLPFFDIEDLFLRIRSKSVSNIAEIAYRVKDTNRRITLKINLDDVQVVTPETHTNKIMITPTMGLVMKYPSLEMLSSDEKPSDDVMMRKCIDYVFNENEVFHFNDFSDAEIDEWIESFDMSILLKIKEFFDTMPRIRHTVEVDLGDGTKETIKFEGLEDFFS